MAGPAADGQGSKGYRAWILFVLILVYVFNFVDRQILGVLAPQIKAELHLTDTQLGLMGGLPFAAFYTFVGLPIAWLADRWSRTWIMTISLAVWSGFTALCGRVTSFSQLVFARMGVGVGEAGGVAPAYSLIADYFPARSRARALAIYSFAIPIGSALGVTCGGLIAHALSWRMAFLIVGLAGLPLVPVLKFGVKDPARVVASAAADGAPAQALGPLEAFGLLLGKPAFWLLSFGAAASSVVGYGLIFWLPSFFQRSFHLSLVETSWFYGGILLFGGVVGVWFGGLIGDVLGAKSRAAYPLVPAVAFLLGAPCFIAAINAPSREVAFLLFLLPQALSLAWLGPILASVQHLVPASGRSTASAAFLLINNLVGIGLGTLFFGAMSDFLKPIYGDQSLKYAVLYGLGFYGVSALCFIAAAFRMKRDWVD